MSVAATGIVSGIDTGALIQATIDAASGPRNALQSRIDDYDTRVEKITELVGKVDALQSALEDIESIGDFRAYSATYDEDNGDFTVEVDGDAVAGSYDITVTSLARAQLDISDVFASRTDTSVFNSGDTLDITYGGTTTTVDLTDKSLSTLATAINRLDGLTAYVVDTGSGYRLAIQGEDEGEAISYSENISGTALNLTNQVAASGAVIEINGIAITSDSNIINDAIPGMTLTLTGETGTSFNVLVDDDPEAIEERIQTFVDAYNDVMSFVRINSVYDADTGIRGPFVGEASVQRVVTGLRNEIGQAFSDLGQDYDSLSLIGISLDRDGELSIDSDTLQDLLVSDPDQIAELFTSDDGFISSMLSRIDLYTDSIDGSLEVRKDSLEDRIGDLEDQVDNQDRRLSRLQIRLQTQYAGMEALLGTLTASADYLAAVLG